MIATRTFNDEPRYSDTHDMTPVLYWPYLFKSRDLSGYARAYYLIR